MKDSSVKAERAVLVHVEFSESADWQEEIAEFRELVASTGAEVAELITAKRDAPDAKFFVGSGKVEEIRLSVALHEAVLVIVNHRLSPAQERNLQDATKARVVDRTRLILDIFAQRARTFEGKLQVELAQLNHLASRLTRGWTHLERQRGGIGLRGPGETQLETDRRLLKARIKTLNSRLTEVRKQRSQNRQSRDRIQLPVVALVGYTNAGKSTLFNQLTGSSVLVANQLFATLDPTVRKLPLLAGLNAIGVDTVGFIRHLPHDLVAAFRATLEETQEANLLLHVIDANSPTRTQQIEQVEAVLKEIGAEKLPVLEVYNKIDLINHCEARVETNTACQPSRIWVSAQMGQGLDLLRQAIAGILFGEPIYREIRLSPMHGRLRAKLYEKQVVLKESVDEEGYWILSVCMSAAEFENLPLS